jgi:mitochondrial import inner membrane translocase subunit TIM23
VSLCTDVGRWDSLLGRKPQKESTNYGPSTDSAPTTTFAAELYVPEVQQAQDFFTPDISQLHPLAGLAKSDLEYLSLDESVINDLPGSRSALPSRGWGDDLCYGTGCTYLTALTIGGAWGLAEGLRKTPSDAPPKIRLNGVLNAVTRRGPFLGNSAGVIAMVYNGINSYIGYARGKRKLSP